MSTILQVRDLVTRFYTFDGVVHALNRVGFDLDEGETLAIVGESGSGKSVTMLSLLHLLPMPPARIEGGQAIFQDNGSQVDLLKLSKTEISRVRGAKIGFIFQDALSALNPVMTVGDQISESLTEHLKMGHDQARKRTIELLDHVGIPGASQRFKNYPHQFSGGMRQRVMIAVAIACNPKLVIADEPTTALDVTVQAQILELLRSIQQKRSMAILYITHDLGVVSAIAHWIYVMYAGIIAEQGNADQIFRSPRHPYTQGLLASLPGLSKRGKRLYSIPGSVPNPAYKPKGCPFHPRCPHTISTCRKEYPDMCDYGHGHMARCPVLYEKREHSE